MLCITDKNDVVNAILNEFFFTKPPYNLYSNLIAGQDRIGKDMIG